MAKYNQGSFQPKNKAKYVGKYPIEFRSAWELTMMNFCDQHPNVLSWASETIKIPYISPFDGRQHMYIPDFLIIYVDATGRKHGEIVEIKPLSQTMVEAAKSRRDKEALILNQAKWQAATAYCRSNNLVFRVITEKQLYKNTKR